MRKSPILLSQYCINEEFDKDLENIIKGSGSVMFYMTDSDQNWKLIWINKAYLITKGSGIEVKV